MTASPVARAEALLAAGRARDAVALVETAADRGDVDALMRLAAWRMIGQPLPRDLGAARALLRRAVAIGHVDAALMEVAMTANGSGGAPDWAGALALLEAAARRDPLAAEHLALVRAMDLDAQGAPRRLPEPERLCESPDVVRIAGLVTPAECDHIARTAQDLLEPAVVIDPATGRTIAHPVRTSHGAVIGPARETLPIRAINHRLAAASGTATAQGEPLSVLRYAPGQQYHPHFDAIAGAANQRIWTALVYLNHGYAGGETRFLASGLTVAGRQGDVVLFRNADREDRPDPRSQHAGLPVTSGVKWLATRWIRARPHDPWNPG